MVEISRTSIPCSPSAGVSKTATRLETDGSYSWAIVSGSSVWILAIKENQVINESHLNMTQYREHDTDEEYSVTWYIRDDRKYLAVACNAQICFFLLHDSFTWKVTFMHRIHNPNAVVHSLASHRNLLYACTTQGLYELKVEIPDIQTTELMSGNPVAVVASNGNYLAAADYSGGIFVWRAGEKLWDKPADPRQRPAEPCITALLVTDKDVLLSGYSDGRARVLDIESGETKAEVSAHCRWVSTLLQTETGFLSAAEDGYVRLWTIAEKNEVSEKDSVRLDESFAVGGICNKDTALLVAYDVPAVLRLTF